jgi:hypothetical protein
MLQTHSNFQKYVTAHIQYFSATMITMYWEKMNNSNKMCLAQWNRGKTIRNDEYVRFLKNARRNLVYPLVIHNQIQLETFAFSIVTNLTEHYVYRKLRHRPQHTDITYFLKSFMYFSPIYCCMLTRQRDKVLVDAGLTVLLDLSLGRATIIYFTDLQHT